MFLDLGTRGINLDQLILWEDIPADDTLVGGEPELLLVLTGGWSDKHRHYPTQIRLNGTLRVQVLAQLRALCAWRSDAA